MTDTPNSSSAPRLRSRAWFDNPENIDMTALYLERYLNFGLSLEELQSGKPIIGIAQSGSDLSPCNRHHLVLAERVREGIRTAGGIASTASITNTSTAAHLRGGQRLQGQHRRMRRAVRE